MADFDPDAYLSATQPAPTPAFDPNQYLAATAPSPQTTTSDSGFTFLPKSGSQMDVGEARQVAEIPAVQNAVEAGADIVKGIPQMALDTAKGAYEGLKFASQPQERANVIEKALGQATQIGQQLSSDAQSPLGSKESFRGIAQLGMMAAPALGDILFPKPEGITAPPVQNQVAPTTAPTLTQVLGTGEKQPITEAVNQSLSDLEKYGTPPPDVAPANEQPLPTSPATLVLGVQEPVALDLPTGTGEDIVENQQQGVSIQRGLGTENANVQLADSGTQPDVILGSTKTAQVVPSGSGAPQSSTPQIQSPVGKATEIVLEPPNSVLAKLSFGDETKVGEIPSFTSRTTSRGKKYDFGLSEYDLPDGRKRFTLSAGGDLVDAGALVKLTPEGPEIQMLHAGQTGFEGLGGALAKEITKRYGKPIVAPDAPLSEATKRFASPVSEAPVSTAATPLTQTERSISGNKTPVAQTGEVGTGGDTRTGFEDAFAKRAIQTPDEFIQDSGIVGAKKDQIYQHRVAVKEAVKQGDPVLASNVDQYRIKLPEGYEQQGDLYVKTPSVSVEGQAPTASVKPETSATSQEIPTGSGIQKEVGTVAALDQLPPVEKGFVRVYRGEPSTKTNRIAPDNRTGRYFTEDPNQAAKYGDKLHYIDVPGEPQGGQATYFLPEEVAKQKIRVEPPSTTAGTQPVAVTPPTEPVTPETPPISTKNAYTEAQRAIRGLPEAEQAAKRGFGKVWDEAAVEAEKDPTIGRRLVSEINSKPRPISDVENAHLLRREIEAQKEHSDAVDAVNNAKTDSDLTAAKARLESARNDLQDVYDATKSAGTKGGQALAARQMLAKEDYSLAKMEARRRAANDGKPLSEQQLSETKALHDKITDLQSKLDAHEVAARFNNEFNKLVEQSRKEAKASKAQGTQFTDFMDRKANEARSRIAERRGRLTTGFDPTSITDEAVIGASHIAKGLTKFADWSAEMVKELGDQIRPFLNDLWERSKAFHDANAREYGDKALARYKTYLGKQTEAIKAKLEVGDFTKAQRQKTQLDKEAFNMRADLQKLKNQFERGVAKEAYRNKSPAQKFWDHFVGVERAMKLSGPEVFGKLGVAAAVPEVLAPIESGVGYAASKAFPALAKGTKYEADLGTLVRGELKAKAALFTDGMKDAWRNVKGQETGLDAIGKQKIRPDFWYNRIGQMHAAIKAPVKRAEFTRDLEQRMAVAVKNGEDINHPEVMTRLANESVMEANRAIFQNKTVVSNFFSALDRTNPVAGRVARFLFPVVKIPVNLFKELVNLHVGAPVGAARVGMAYWKGVETLPAVQREAIIRQLTKGSIGGAGLLWGYYNQDKVRNFFDHAPVWFQHTPMAMILNEGSYLKGLQGTKDQATQSTKELAYMAKTDIPFMYTIKDIGDALDTHNSHALQGWINNMTQSTVVPQILTQTAKQMDKPGTFPSNIGERPTFRPASNPIEAVKLGIPGLRQTVPEKTAKTKVTHRRRR